MQVGAVAAERLAARLRQIDPTLAAEVGPALAKLAADERAEAPNQEHLAAVAAVLPRIAERLPPAAAADRQALVDRQYVRVLRQYTELGTNPLGNPQVRDRAMADNVRWIADVAEPGSRIVLWAHNGHISNADFRFTSMGHHLEAALGEGYLRVGFLFHHGGFQAVDATGRGRGVHELTVGPPPAGTLEDTFERAGWPLCLLDLGRLPASGPVAEWFRSLQPMREIGAAFRGEADMATEVVLPDRYEAVIYVEATTRARPNPPAQLPDARLAIPRSGRRQTNPVFGPQGSSVLRSVNPRRPEVEDLARPPWQPGRSCSRRSPLIGERLQPDVLGERFELGIFVKQDRAMVPGEGGDQCIGERKLVLRLETGGGEQGRLVHLPKDFARELLQQRIPTIRFRRPFLLLADVVDLQQDWPG